MRLSSQPQPLARCQGVSEPSVSCLSTRRACTLNHFRRAAAVPQSEGVQTLCSETTPRRAPELMDRAPSTPSPSKHRTKRDDKPVSERESAQIIAGDQQHIRTLFEGEFFGEISLLEEKASSASVRAAEYTSLMVLLVDQFQYGTRPGPGASHAHPHSPPPAPPSTGTSARGSRS